MANLVNPNTLNAAEELRAKNLSTIEFFISHPELDSIDNFTCDAVKEVTFATFTDARFGSSPDHPITFSGKEQIRQNFIEDAEEIEFSWLHPVVYSTQDPNRFWVETAVKGIFKLEGGVRKEYNQPYYVLTFEMEGGKIKKFREIMNPLRLMETVDMLPEGALE